MQREWTVHTGQTNAHWILTIAAATSLKVHFDLVFERLNGQTKIIKWVKKGAKTS